MLIKIKPPSPAEAEWKFDPKTNELIIEVFFYGNQRSQNVGYVETVGRNGAVNRGTLRASGNTGRMQTMYPTGDPITCEFDKITSPT